MLKLVARVVPVALMSVPLTIYRGHFDGLDRSSALGRHTYEARSMAERVARDAGAPPRPARLDAEIREFARQTADNPSQVERAARMRAAMSPLDRATISRLAEEAIAEEERLLVPRSAEAHAALAELRWLADRVFAMSVAMILLPHLVEFALRKMAPATPATAVVDAPPEVAGPAAEPRDRAEAIVAVDADVLQMAGLINDLQSKLMLYESRFGREQSHLDLMRSIQALKGQLPETTGGEHGRG